MALENNQDTNLCIKNERILLQIYVVVFFIKIIDNKELTYNMISNKHSSIKEMK